MKKYFFFLVAICFAVNANAQKSKTDSIKLKKRQTADSIKRSNQIYTKADVMPSFPGGDAGLRDYLSKNLQYPTRDREDNNQGKAYVRFVVEKDGSLSHIKALEAPTTTMAMEAERLVKAMPKWQPGIVATHVSRVQFTIAINFNLEP